MSAWDDTVILANLQSGNANAAFTQCYVKYRSYLMVLALSILHSESEAQDMVQEFFTEFWEKKLYNSIETSLKNFLFTAVKHKCLNKLRNDTRRSNRLKDLSFLPNYTMPDKRMEDEGFRQELDAAIKVIPPLSCKVFQLAYIHHKSRNEIAEEMGISPNTVKNQLMRAIKILRVQLKKEQ